MIRIPNRIIETYAYKDYIVEICKEEVFGVETYEAYLQREGIAIKELMFGVTMEDNTLDEFIALVDADLDDYIEEYEENHII